MNSIFLKVSSFVGIRLKAEIPKRTDLIDSLSKFNLVMYTKRTNGPRATGAQEGQNQSINVY